MLSPEDERMITVSKLEAAKRQLDCAIHLWFHDGDDVSTHTLAATAHQVLHDIHRKIGAGSPIFSPDIVKEEYHKQWQNIVKRPWNFFKHADNDPDPEGTLKFPAFATTVYFLFSFQMLADLNERNSDLIAAFTTWMAVQESSIINPQFIRFVQQIIKVDQRNFLKRVGKAEFLKLYLEQRKVTRAEVTE